MKEVVKWLTGVELQGGQPRGRVRLLVDLSGALMLRLAVVGGLWALGKDGAILFASFW